MSVESVFYPGVIERPDRTAFIASALWPLAMGTHYNMDGKLFVTAIEPHNSGCLMSDAQGFPVLRIRVSGGVYKFTILDVPGYSWFTRTGATGYGSVTCIADSPNSRYLLMRLRDTKTGKRKKTMRQQIMAHLEHTSDVFPNIVHDQLQALTSKLHPHRSNSEYEISLAAQEWALLLAYGHKTMVEVPSDIKPMLDRASKMHIEKHTRFDTFVQEATDFLDREKWVVCHMPLYGFLAAKIHGKELVSYCKERTKNVYAKRAPIQFIEPLRYYASLEAMPETTRREILAAMALAKANRPEGAIEHYTDADKLFPNMTASSYVQERVGAVYQKTGYAHWCMVDA